MPVREMTVAVKCALSLASGAPRAPCSDDFALQRCRDGLRREGVGVQEPLAGIAPERRAHFGRVLQRHRGELSVKRDVEPAQAAEVMTRIGALVMGDSVLQVDGLAMTRR